MEENLPQMSFSQARKALKNIFQHISDYIDNVHSFIAGCPSGWIEGIEMENQTRRKEKLKLIMDKIDRNHMKVVFFGRTSGGKSTVVNAMLRNKILPSGCGHTTNCFLQVEGTDSHEGFLLTEDKPKEQKSIQLLNKLANALKPEKMKPNSLIRVSFPKEKCRLLKEGVLFVDSPGKNVTTDLDTWIDKFCQDADVFVVVVNGEETLTETEKDFFYKVKERISKPNIIILENKWDRVVTEEDAETVEEVKQQHIDVNHEFLVDTLGVTDIDRVFFVSARERLNHHLGTSKQEERDSKGFQARLDEFKTFERKFEECISTSAIKTKFEQHAHEGREVTKDLKALMDKILERSLEQLERKKPEKEQKANDLRNKLSQREHLTVEVEDKITTMVKDIEKRTSSALNNGIETRLSEIVNDFNRPFHPEPAQLNSYKTELREHVETNLGRHAQYKCSPVLNSVVDMQTTVTERFSDLVPERTIVNRELMPDFENAYRPDCNEMFADFKEDIAYNFLRNNKTVSTFAAAGMVGSLYANSTMPLALIPAGMTLVYAYDRSSWNDGEGERVFKKQCVDHVGSKLHLLVDQISSNCSHQARQEVKSTFKSCCQRVVRYCEMLTEEIKQLDTEISQLNDINAKAKNFRNKADRLGKELNSFTEQYLEETV